LLPPPTWPIFLVLKIRFPYHVLFSAFCFLPLKGYALVEVISPANLNPAIYAPVAVSFFLFYVLPSHFFVLTKFSPWWDSPVKGGKRRLFPQSLNFCQTQNRSFFPPVSSLFPSLLEDLTSISFSEESTSFPLVRSGRGQKWFTVL